MHEHQVIVSGQDGVKLLVPNRGELGHVPGLALVEGDVNAPCGTLGNQNIIILRPPRRERKGMLGKAAGRDEPPLPALRQRQEGGQGPSLS